jgi:N2227-like protein
MPGEAEAKFAGLKAASSANAVFCNAIVAAQYGRAREAVVATCGREAPMPASRAPPTTPGRHWSKLRSTLHQCVRDWAAEGAAERAECYAPLIEELVRRLPVTPETR